MSTPLRSLDVSALVRTPRCWAHEHEYGARREQQTITTLASKLGLDISANHVNQKLKAVVKDILACEGVVPTAWDHKFLPAIAKELADGDTPVPRSWCVASRAPIPSS